MVKIEDVKTSNLISWTHGDGHKSVGFVYTKVSPEYPDGMMMVGCTDEGGYIWDQKLNSIMEKYEVKIIEL